MMEDEFQSALDEVALKGRVYELRQLFRVAEGKDREAVAQAMIKAIPNSGDGFVLGLCHHEGLPLEVRFAALEAALKQRHFGHLEDFFSCLGNEPLPEHMMQKITSLLPVIVRLPVRNDIQGRVWSLLVSESVPLSLKLDVVRACEETEFLQTVVWAYERQSMSSCAPKAMPAEVAQEIEAALLREKENGSLLNCKIAAMEAHLKQKNAGASSQTPPLQTAPEQEKLKMAGLAKPKEPVRAVEQPFRAKLFGRG